MGMGCVNANVVSMDLCASTANVLMTALAMANVPHSVLPSEHRARSTRAVSVTMDSVAMTFARRQLGNARFGCHLGRQGTSPRAVLRLAFVMLASKEVSAVN